MPDDHDLRDLLPVPDPTKLTTDAVNAATAAFRRDLDALKELLEQRIAGMAHAEDLLRTRIQERFTLVEQLRVEQKADVKAAVDAALAAQKEAIIKTEVATKEQINGLALTQRTADEALRRDIDDLKARMTTVEAMKIGQAETTRHGFDTAQIGLALMVLVVSIAAIIVTILIAANP